jgi:hypothetical protein
MSVTFTTKLLLDDGMNATGISVPPEVVAQLGPKKRVPVKVTINGNFTYSSTIAPYGNVYMLPVSQERRAEAGIKPNETIEVTLEVDTEPRTVEVPADLAVALDAANARAAFDAKSFTNRKEYVRSVEDAKTQETRERRIAKVVTELTKPFDFKFVP